MCSVPNLNYSTIELWSQKERGMGKENPDLTTFKLSLVFSWCKTESHVDELNVQVTPREAEIAQLHE